MSDPADKYSAEALRIDPIKMRSDADLVRRRFWDKLRSSLARIPFADRVIAARYAATDPATPLRDKAVLLGALAYFIMPVDAVPDFVTLLGFTDDLAVLTLALRTAAGSIREEHRQQARAWLDGHSVSTAKAEDVAKGPIIDHDGWA